MLWLLSVRSYPYGHTEYSQHGFFFEALRTLVLVSRAAPVIRDQDQLCSLFVAQGFRTYVPCRLENVRTIPADWDCDCDRSFRLCFFFFFFFFFFAIARRKKEYEYKIV